MKKLLFTTFFILSCLNNFAQYFQQDVSYTIDVQLDDLNHFLRGNETIVYKNNSNDTLHELYFHLWPNAYKNNTTFLAKQLYRFGDDELLNTSSEDKGYIDSLNFRIDNAECKFALLNDTIDVCKIELRNPIAPGQTIKITTPFRVKIPSGSISRFGHTKQSYFVSQWYPKPAVYDHTGWNYFPYLDKGEFYSEFGTFDVNITLPQNYLVAASGVLMNNKQEEEFILSKKEKLKSLSDSFDFKKYPASSPAMKKLHFHAENVHDFAWFTDKRYFVYEEQFKLPSGKTVTASTFTTSPRSRNWKRSNEYIKGAALFYSSKVGEYPYDRITVADVGDASAGGMEYPMVTAINETRDTLGFENVIAHEVGHNWFYGILANNERRYSWMDEGCNNFLDQLYTKTKYPEYLRKNISPFPKLYFPFSLIKNKSEIDYWYTRAKFNYTAAATENKDQSSSTRPEYCTRNNFRILAYTKTMAFLDYMQFYLGQPLFDSCFQTYFNEWKFKHPAPSDMKEVFERVSGKNLDWFFEQAMATSDKADYAVSSVKNSDNNLTFKLKNKRKITAPVNVSFFSNDSLIKSAFIPGFKSDTVIKENIAATKIVINNNQLLPEVDLNNNTIYTSGILKRSEPVEFKLGYGLNSKDKSRIYYAPVVGYNAYDKAMAGIVFHNVNPVERKIEYTLMPMFSTGDKTISGGGDIRFNFYPSGKTINKITFKQGISSYAYYDDEYYRNDVLINKETLRFIKSDSRLIFEILPKVRTDFKLQTFTLRNVFINRDIPYFFNYASSRESYNVSQLIYSFKDNNPLNKHSYQASISVNQEYFRADFTAEKFIRYSDQKDKGFSFRFFAGYTSIAEKISPDIDYRMSLGGREGSRDFLFDEVFIGRNESSGLWSRQFISNDAGFKVPTYFYRLADNWMSSVNMTTTLPGIIPLKLFLDIGVFDNSDKLPDAGAISYDFGAQVDLYHKMISIYVPFAQSKDIEYIMDQQNLSLIDMIRFELRMNLVNPLEQFRNRY